MRHLVLIGAGLAVLASSGALARGPVATGTPASVQALFACRSMKDSNQRLACYDREAVAIEQAMSKRELVMIDKARATQAKRSLFGFSIPDFGGLFGGAGDEVKQIASSVASFGHNADGGWVVRLADGSTWSQTDDAMLGLPPEKGQKVVVARGSFGTFFLRLNGQPGFKVKRIG
jgi:hypothetical protein